jgi:hypothetical protein
MRVRAKRKRQDAEQGWTSVWFLVEGRPRRFRCRDGSGLFQLGPEVGGQVELTCLSRQRHRVLAGFYVQPPGELDDAGEPAWIGEVLRGEQLGLKFGRKPIVLGVTS